MKIRNMKQVTERVKGLKGRKLFRRNQIIITTLAVMIAAAGYLNYAGKRDLEEMCIRDSYITFQVYCPCCV